MVLGLLPPAVKFKHPETISGLFHVIPQISLDLIIFLLQNSPTVFMRSVDVWGILRHLTLGSWGISRWPSNLTHSFLIRKMLSTHQYGHPPVVQLVESAGSSVLEEADIIPLINTVIQH